MASRLNFSVDSLLSTVTSSASPEPPAESKVCEKLDPGSEQDLDPTELDDEEIDVESDTEPEDIEDTRPKLAHPRPLFGGPHQPPFLAAGLAAMAAAAAASAAAGKHPSLFTPTSSGTGSASPPRPHAGLFPSLNGWSSASGVPPSFPPLGFPGFQHPLFKPGEYLKLESTRLPVSVALKSANSEL